MTTSPTAPPTPAPNSGWILYDAVCPVCLGFVERLGPTLRSRGFVFEPLQADWVKERLALPPEKLLEEMRVLTPDGKVLGGADAMMHLAGSVWWASPLWLLFQIPGCRQIIRACYRWFAARRYCAGGTCQIPKRPGGPAN